MSDDECAGCDEPTGEIVEVELVDGLSALCRGCRDRAAKLTGEMTIRGP